MTNNRAKEQKRCRILAVTGVSPQGQMMILHPNCPQTNTQPSSLLNMASDWCEFWIDEQQECGFILLIDEIRKKQPQINI